MLLKSGCLKKQFLRTVYLLTTGPLTGIIAAALSTLPADMSPQERLRQGAFQPPSRAGGNFAALTV